MFTFQAGRGTAGRMAAQALTTAGAVVLASTLQVSAAQADPATATWTAPVQVTPPASASTQSVLTTTPSGLLEAYLQEDILVLRRHTSAGWAAPINVIGGQVSDGSDVQAVAGTDTRAFVVSESDQEVLTLTTVRDNGTLSAVEFAAGFAPTIAVLPDGSAVVSYLTADGTQVRAVHALADGGVENDTAVATTANGLDSASVVVDKDGQALVIWAECADVDCTTSRLQSSTRTDATTWSAPATVLSGADIIGLTATSGQGKVLLNWLSFDAATDEVAPQVLEQAGGVWGTPQTVYTYGYPMIAPDGTEILADGYGAAAWRGADGEWLDAPAGPGGDEDCDAGSVPALEAGTLVLHQSVPDPLEAGSCRIMESRIDLATPASVSDVTAPVVTITSAPSARSNNPTPAVAFVTSETSTTVCSLDGVAFTACTSPKTYSGVKNGVHTFVVAASDPAGNWSFTSRRWLTDLSPPFALVTAPTVPLGLANPMVVRWDGTDIGESSLISFDVRITKAAPGAGFSAWSYPTYLQHTKAKTTSLPAYPGYTSCVQARANDGAGNVGAWSPQRCAALPMDDRSLSASAGWSRIVGSPFFAKTATSTTRLGATLVSPTLQTTRLALVATKCRTCGVVGVYSGSTLLAKVNLAAPSTSYRNVIGLPRISLRTTKVTVRVLTSGKTVQIDGLATSRV